MGNERESIAAVSQIYPWQSQAKVAFPSDTRSSGFKSNTADLFGASLPLIRICAFAPATPAIARRSTKKTFFVIVFNFKMNIEFIINSVYSFL
jgi:hypothetical protein